MLVGVQALKNMSKLLRVSFKTTVALTLWTYWGRTADPPIMESRQKEVSVMSLYCAITPIKVKLSLQNTLSAKGRKECEYPKY